MPVEILKEPEEQLLWRYMTEEKFLKLLSNSRRLRMPDRALFFCFI